MSAEMSSDHLGYLIATNVKAALAAQAAEVEALRKANEHFGKRQKWWDEKMFSLEQERDALREELQLCCELKREYQTQVASMVDQLGALRELLAEWLDCGYSKERDRRTEAVLGRSTQGADMNE